MRRRRNAGVDGRLASMSTGVTSKGSLLSCSARTAPTRRMMLVRSGKMPTTSVRRRISGLRRSLGLLDQAVEVAVPVAVATVGPLRAGGAVLGATDRVGLRGHQRVDEGLQQLLQQIRARLGQLPLKQMCRIDTGGDGHRGRSFPRVLWKVHSKDHPVAVTYLSNDTLTCHQRSQARQSEGDD